MADLIFNNGSLKIGYNDVPWTFRTGEHDRYMSFTSPTTRPIGSFREEAIIAVKEIRAAYAGKTLYVLYSGGIDSEAMLEAFRLAGIKITVVMIEFEDGLNSHDMEYARSYLRRTNFTGRVLVFPLNILSWLRSNECRDLARDIRTPTLIFTPLFKIAGDHLRDGVVITAHEEPTLIKVDGTWVWNRSEVHYSLHKYFIKEGISGVPAYFQWSTELIASFIFNPHYSAAYAGLYNNSIWNAEMLKYGFYWREFKLPARTKYTGFEKVIFDINQTNEEWRASLSVPWDAEVNYELKQWHRDMNVRRNATIDP